MARKPLDGTVTRNVQAHGTGAIHVDACRVGTEVMVNPPRSTISSFSLGDGWRSDATPTAAIGRWPPNFLLSHSPDCDEACAEDCPVAEMDRQSGKRKGSPLTWSRGERETYVVDLAPRKAGESFAGYGDSGTASRFFPVFRYQAKPSTRERDAGLDALPVVAGHDVCDREEGSAGASNPRARTRGERRNTHPTVKPIDMMRWLVRLVTPRGGLVLDPFAGSGTTGCAAALEGARFVGIELDERHAEIARARIAHWSATTAPAEAAPQLDLFTRSPSSPAQSQQP